MAANAAAVKQQLAARKDLLAHVDAELAGLIAKQIAEQKAAEQARTMALLMRQRSIAEGGIILGGNPPTSSKAAAAVYWAEKEIGKPYVWAAAGPDSFDCSGLMVWAYAHVGISLNHYSGDQINEGARVSRSNLEPGDLVFFGSPIHHVGMYVGGGDFIEAPYTGTDVRISKMSSRSDFAGACRPTAR
jgi:cell wall-associated NlpC family hydrolase